MLLYYTYIDFAHIFYQEHVFGNTKVLNIKSRAHFWKYQNILVYKVVQLINFMILILF